MDGYGARSGHRRQLRRRLDRATAHLDPPFAVVDLDAFDANAAASPAGPAASRSGWPASRCAAATCCAASWPRPGWRGVMAYTLPEAIWLVRAGVTDDVLVGYPTADRAALAELAADADLAAAITLMVDSTAQLDLIDAVTPPAAGAELRVCLDLDAVVAARPAGVHIGVRRSPVHSPRRPARSPRAIAGRPGFRLVGADVVRGADRRRSATRPPGRPLRGARDPAMQRRSYRELLRRRGGRGGRGPRSTPTWSSSTAAAPAASPPPRRTRRSPSSPPAPGSTARRSSTPTARWRPTPAAFFALSVVRRPAPGIATVLGGGWIASGAGRAEPAAACPCLPAGLRLIRTEGAGEVQTPLVGPAADALRLGDRVWFRHAKAGELCEHVNELHLVERRRGRGRPCRPTAARATPSSRPVARPG